MSESCEDALVLSISTSGQARVFITRAEACNACAAKGACHVMGGQTQDVELLLDNPVGARVGDTVRLNLAESSVIKASAVLYLNPALGLLLGALAGYGLGHRLAIVGDLPALVGAFSGMTLGLGVAFVLGRRLARSPAYTPRLAAVVRRADGSDL